ncbi:sensor histidine kinase [Fredinandcohnia humi]
MGTKWRNRIWLIAWLVLFSFGLSGIITANLGYNNYIKQSYFESPQFQRTMEEFNDYIYSFDISYQSIEEMKKDITISNEEIEEYRSRYGNLTDQITDIEQQYNHKIEEAKTNNNQKTADLYTKERDKKIDEMTSIFEDDEYIKEVITREKQDEIDHYFKELEGYRETFESYKEAFVYYLENTENGEIYTNLPSKDRSSVNQFINNKTMHFIQNYPTKKNHYLELGEEPLVWGNHEVIDYSKIESNDLYEGKIAVSKKTPTSNRIMLAFQSYDNERISFWIYTIAAIIALVTSILIGKKIKSLSRIAPQKWQSRYNKIPFDLAVVIICISIISSLAIITSASYLYYNIQVDDILLVLFWSTILIGLTMIQAIYLYSRIKNIALEETIWKKTFVARTVNLFKNAFLNRKVGTQVLLILTLIFLFGLGFGLSGVEDDILVFVIPIFLLIGIPLFILIMRKIGYFNKILLNAKALADGKFEPDLQVKGKTVLAELAGTINDMKYGVKTSQNAQAKSERLKTELITNVSHDLRTPLTSIITYTELLKDKNLHEDERNSYVEIIDKKSKRLKVLIDDLFEASKMASGAIDLTKSKVNIVELLHQSFEEYTEDIQDSMIQFRISKPDHPVFAFVDGQKLWRVFENLIGNIIKYSLENSRAFIAISEQDNQVIITFKNVTKYELSENIDELFERFKRGDESRHTDGSGLGLAIAKSIIDLHEGTMDIEVDGDLFKVTVILSKAATT